MLCRIVFPDICCQEIIELLQGADLADVEPVEPSFLKRPEIPLHLPLAGPIPDRGMQKHCPNGCADQIQLPVFVGRAGVHIQLVRDPISRHGVLEHLLEVVCILLVKDPSAHDHPGVVVQDHDQIGPVFFPCSSR